MPTTNHLQPLPDLAATPDHRQAGHDLRARNLARNRAEVADAALALFEERGFEAVTVDEVAAAAGISRRTFFRYFASKEDAVLPYEGEWLVALEDALATRPPEEPLSEALRHAALSMAEAADDGERFRTLRCLTIAARTPAVHAAMLERQSRWEETLRAVVADRLGVDPETSVAVRVIAGATIAAFRAAADAWVDSGGAADPGALMAEAIDVLASGLTPADS